MEWVQFIIFFLGVFGLFVWNRTESRADIRHMDSKLEVQRGMMLEIHRECAVLQRESTAQIKAIHDEMKDFHFRLLEIERNRKV